MAVGEDPPAFGQETPFWEEGLVETVLDDLAGRELKPARVREARAAELEFIRYMEVGREVVRSDLESRTQVVRERHIDNDQPQRRGPPELSAGTSLGSRA